MRVQISAVSVVVLAGLGWISTAFGQGNSKGPLSGYDRSARATVVHPATVYVGADGNSQHVTEVTPGHEVVIMSSNGDWVQVFANTDTPEEQADQPEFAPDPAPPESGWIRNKGVVSPATPHGDVVLYGAAENFEDQAAQIHGPKDAAQAAEMLYLRVWQYFPDSPLAAVALWRSADDRWQIDKADIGTLPSAKEQDAYLRPQIYEGDMKRVMKLYPGTKYAALAAYDLLDNKLCGDWQGLPKCPEMEAGLYERYAERYPDSPKAAEALYYATYREGVLVSMYQVDADRKRVEQAAKNTQALADEMKQRYPDSDYTTRAEYVAYRVQQDIPVYGEDRD